MAETKSQLRDFIKQSLESGTNELTELVTQEADLKDRLAEVMLAVGHRRQIVDEMKAWLEANP